MSDSPVHAPHEYVVVARRYRPQSFEGLIGQQHVARALVGAIESQRVGHAYLCTGARGVGKTSAARILAKALNCVEGPTATPCNECEVCRAVAGGDDVDVLEIDGASNRGIDEIRQLRQNVAVRPSRARFKIYIIDEVHMLTKEAFNALLKTLEEPPEHVKFIFATTEPNKIPITILSRCQRYDFAGIEATAIRDRLAEIAAAEQVTVEPDALDVIALRAAGSMRDSQSLLEQLLATGKRQVTSQDVTELLGLAPAARLSRLVQPLVERDAAAVLGEFAAALADGAEPGQIIDQLLGFFRDAMTQAVGCPPSQMLYVLPSQREEVRAVAQRIGVETLLAMSQVLDHAASRMRISTQVRTLSEMALVRICRLENLDELAALVDQLRTGETPAIRPGGGTPLQPIVKKNERTDSSLAPQSSLGRSENSASAAASKVASEVPPAAESAVQVGEVPACQLEAEPVDGRGREQASEQVGSVDGAAPGAEQLWKQTLELVAGLVYDHAAAVERVSLDAQGRLSASFPATPAGKFHRDTCQRPNNFAKIEAALAEAAGKRVPLLLATHESAPGAAPPKQLPTNASVTDKQAELAALESPFVVRAMALFAGEASQMRHVRPQVDNRRKSPAP